MLTHSRLTQRFARADKRNKLPKCTNQYITHTATNLSTDMAVVTSRRFLRSMAQPFEVDQKGISLWDVDDIAEKQRETAEAERGADGEEGRQTIAVEEDPEEQVMRDRARDEDEAMFAGIADSEFMEIDT